MHVTVSHLRIWRFYNRKGVLRGETLDALVRGDRKLSFYFLDEDTSVPEDDSVEATVGGRFHRTVSHYFKRFKSQRASS